MTRIASPIAGVIALGLLIAPLTGCAPEPGTVSPDGSDLTEKVEPEGGSWAEENPDEVYAKDTQLPEGFPAGFVLPEGSVIDDAGSRGYGSWYVVLRAADAEAAETLWDAIVSEGGFTVSDDAATGDGGRSATLTTAAMTVQAVTMPAEDGDGTLLSYDLTEVVS